MTARKWHVNLIGSHKYEESELFFFNIADNSNVKCLPLYLSALLMAVKIGAKFSKGALVTAFRM